LFEKGKERPIERRNEGKRWRKDREKFPLVQDKYLGIKF
jgi:hypothetical protein